MKFSELLGEPEPERTTVPEPDAEPISVFTPEPEPPRTTDGAPKAPAPVTAPPVSSPPMTAPPIGAPPNRPQASPTSRFADNVVAPGASRSGLAELNVRPEAPGAPVSESSVLDQLEGLEAVVDDLLPSSRHRSRK